MLLSTGLSTPLDLIPEDSIQNAHFVCALGANLEVAGIAFPSARFYRDRSNFLRLWTALYLRLASSPWPQMDSGLHAGHRSMRLQQLFYLQRHLRALQVRVSELNAGIFRLAAMYGNVQNCPTTASVHWLIMPKPYRRGAKRGVPPV